MTVLKQIRADLVSYHLRNNQNKEPSFYDKFLGSTNPDLLPAVHEPAGSKCWGSFWSTGLTRLSSQIKYSRFAHQISFHPSLHICSYYLTGNLPISFVPSRDATSFHTGKHLSLLSGVLLQLLAVFTLKQTPFSRISCFFKHAGLSSILAETLSISSCFSASSKTSFLLFQLSTENHSLFVLSVTDRLSVPCLLKRNLASKNFSSL